VSLDTRRQHELRVAGMAVLMHASDVPSPPAARLVQEPRHEHYHYRRQHQPGNHLHSYLHTRDPLRALRAATVFAAYKLGAANSGDGFLTNDGLEALLASLPAVEEVGCRVLQ
jgi:hypothetical protein